jgi:hypothetical protein
MIDFKFEMVNNNIQTAFKDNKTDIIIKEIIKK